MIPPGPPQIQTLRPPAQALKKDKYCGQQQPPCHFSPGSNNLAIDVGQVFPDGRPGQSLYDSIGSQLHYTYGVSDLFGFTRASAIGALRRKFSMADGAYWPQNESRCYDKVVPYAVFGMGFYKMSTAYQLAARPRMVPPPPSFPASLWPAPGDQASIFELRAQIFFGAALTLHDVFGDSETPPTTRRSTWRDVHYVYAACGYDVLGAAFSAGLRDQLFKPLRIEPVFFRAKITAYRCGTVITLSMSISSAVPTSTSARLTRSHEQWHSKSSGAPRSAETPCSGKSAKEGGGLRSSARLLGQGVDLADVRFDGLNFFGGRAREHPELKNPRQPI